MEEFSALIGQIYDTILDPDRWPAVLTLIAGYAGAARCLLILEDALDPLKSAFHLSFNDPDWTGSYLQTYLLINPMRLAIVGQVRAGDVVLTSDFMTKPEYRRSRFAREFLSQRGMIDVAAAVLEKTATSITVLSLVRSAAQGVAGEAVRAKLAMIGPHVRRAAEVGRIFRRQKLDAATLADALDRVDGAVFLLDRAGTILHANEGARVLLSQGVVARGAAGRLVPSLADARAALSEALDGSLGGDDGLGLKGVAIVFGTQGAETLLGHVVALTSGARKDAGAAYRAVAALCIRSMRFDVPSSAGALSDVYGLTRREVMVLVSIVEVGGVAEAAAALGLTDATVRSHLKSVFRKTGAQRQSDLVKLVASTMGPLAP